MIKLNTIFSRIMSIGEVQRQSIVSFILQIAYTVIGFISTMYFAHVVGASVLGAYFLFLAYYGIIDLVIGGLSQAAVKRISEGEEENQYFSTFVILHSLLVVLIVVALIAVRSHFIDLNNANTFIWLLLALLVSLVFRTVYSGVAGCGKIGIFATCNFINDISRVLIQILAVFFGYGVAGLAGGFIAGMLVATVIELKFLDLRFVRFGWKHVKSISGFSFWLILTSSGMLVFSYSDTVLIGYFLDNTNVGVYRVVLQFTSVAVLTTSALRAALWPKVSRWGKTGEIELIEKSLSRAFSYSLIVAVPVFAGGILLGDRLLYFFYGAEFAISYTTLVILLAVQIVNIFQYFFTMYLNALDRQKDSFKVTAFSATTNIAMNLMLIPIMGITGAAIATLVTLTLNVVLAWQVLSRVMVIRMEHDTFLNILTSSFILSLVVASYRLLVPLSNVWLTMIPVVIGGIVYVILMLKFDENIYNDIQGLATQMYRT